MITFLLRNIEFKRAKMGGLGVMGISIEGENWNIVSGLSIMKLILWPRNQLEN